MKRILMTIILLCSATNSMAQEMAADVESAMEVEVAACSDGTVADAACVDLNSHPTIERTGELLTLLLEKEVKKAQAFCDQSQTKCLSTIEPYFKKTPQSYQMRSVKLINDEHLNVLSIVEAKVVLGDGVNKNLYTFVLEFQRKASNQLWKIMQVSLKDQEPDAMDDEAGFAVMDAVSE